MIKSRKVIKKEIEYYEVCGDCGKEIKGTAKGQVEYNMSIHLSSKHDKHLDWKTGKYIKRKIVVEKNGKK